MRGLDLISLARRSMASANNEGERTSPCLVLQPPLGKIWAEAIMRHSWLEVFCNKNIWTHLIKVLLKPACLKGPIRPIEGFLRVQIEKRLRPGQVSHVFLCGFKILCDGCEYLPIDTYDADGAIRHGESRTLFVDTNSGFRPRLRTVAFSESVIIDLQKWHWLLSKYFLILSGEAAHSRRFVVFEFQNAFITSSVVIGHVICSASSSSVN